LKSYCVLQDHYDDERDKIVQDQDQDGFFGLTQTEDKTSYFTDHITGYDYEVYI